MFAIAVVILVVAVVLFVFGFVLDRKYSKMNSENNGLNFEKHNPAVRRFTQSGWR